MRYLLKFSIIFLHIFYYQRFRCNTFLLLEIWNLLLGNIAFYVYNIYKYIFVWLLYADLLSSLHNFLLLNGKFDSLNFLFGH